MSDFHVLRAIRFLAAAVFFVTAAPAFAQFGSILGDLTQTKILGETIRNGVTLEKQLTALRDGLDVARNNLSFVRSVYGGVNDLVHFNSDQFLSDAQMLFFSRNPTLADSMSFTQDFRRNGFTGGFNAWAINNQIDEYNRQECENYLKNFVENGLPVPEQIDYGPCREAGWNAYSQQVRDGYRVTGRPPSGVLSTSRVKTGQGVSDVIEDTLADDTKRTRLAYEPRPGTPSDGLLYTSIGNSDPAVLNQLLHSQARSRDIESKSMALYLKTLDDRKEQSVASLTKVSALSNAATAAELARLNETQSKMAAQQQAKLAREQASQDAFRQEQAIRAATFGRMLSNSFRDSAPVPGNPP